MRILLINTNQLKIPFPVMPVGLCSVAASLEAAGHQVKVLDLCFSLNPAADIAAAVASFSPGMACAGIRNIDMANGFRPAFMLDKIKTGVIVPLKRVFSGPVVLGGPAAGINGAELLGYFDCDYAVQGDGEGTTVALANRIEADLSPGGMAGLIIRRKGIVAEANPPDFPDDLDTLPPSRPQKYLNCALYKLYNSPFPVQTKRGCALSCVYCTYNRIEGRVYRLRSPSAIADEIQEFAAATGNRTVEIVDSTFNVPLDHAKAVLREIISRNVKLRLLTMGLNPRFLDRELAGLMKQAGFVEACFGTEAICDDMLKSFGKNFSVADIRAAADIIHQTRIPASWFLIIGAPGETAKTIKETFSNISRIAAPLDLVNIGVGIRVYNGAPIAETWKAETKSSTPDNFLTPVAYQPGTLTMKKLKAVTRLAAALHHNFFMFDEGAVILLPVRIIMGLFFANQPLWRGYIVMRLFEKYSGVFLVRALIAWVRCNAAFRKGMRAIMAAKENKMTGDRSLYRYEE
ncbi:MAG TPA: radical SAM protein [Chitinivibrionales bacterium]|nr:radical SAM protein [Chitinivibrionales bacterium]